MSVAMEVHVWQAAHKESHNSKQRKWTICQHDKCLPAALLESHTGQRHQYSFNELQNAAAGRAASSPSRSHRVTVLIHFMTHVWRGGAAAAPRVCACVCLRATVDLIQLSLFKYLHCIRSKTNSNPVVK